MHGLTCIHYIHLLVCCIINPWYIYCKVCTVQRMTRPERYGTVNDIQYIRQFEYYMEWYYDRITFMTLRLPAHQQIHWWRVSEIETIIWRPLSIPKSQKKHTDNFLILYTRDLVCFVADRRTQQPPNILTSLSLSRSRNTAKLKNL